MTDNPDTLTWAQHLERQIAFSLATFGPGERLEGVLDHLAEEIEEVAARPDDLVEWADVFLLAVDGAWRLAVYRTGQPVDQVAQWYSVLRKGSLVADAERCTAVLPEGGEGVTRALQWLRAALTDRAYPEAFRFQALIDAALGGGTRAAVAHHGHTNTAEGAAALIGAMTEKLARNERRAWPDWRTADRGRAIKSLDPGG